MMPGNNSLVLNQATMQEIVQYWIDNKMINKDESAPKVAYVRPSIAGGDDFVIGLASAESK